MLLFTLGESAFFHPVFVFHISAELSAASTKKGSNQRGRRPLPTVYRRCSRSPFHHSASAFPPFPLSNMTEERVEARSRGFRARLGSMTLTRMESMDKTVGDTCPMPEVPRGGARIKVH